MALAETVSGGLTATEIAGCRMTGSRALVPILDLGMVPLSGIFPAADVEVPSAPLELVLAPEGGLVQLRHSCDPALMYGAHYGYRSGLNGSMRTHLAEIAQGLERRRPTRAGEVVLDIGSNDGTLLGCYRDHGQTFLGIDPTVSKFWPFYRSHITTVADFFSVEAYRRVAGDRPASLITSIAMLYDLEDPLAFVQAVASILADDGLWHTEQSYLPTMLDRCAYDTICHEHLEYYGLTQLQWLAERADLRIIDATENPTNGGSLAVTFAHVGSPYQANRAHVDRLLEREARHRLTTAEAFETFQLAVERHRRLLPALIRELRHRGKRVIGYGASTKGNILLHACGLTIEDLPCIADVNPDKHGKVTPGTQIPIVSEAEAHATQPDYMLVLPWHFKDYIIERERAFLERGGRLIFPLPLIDVVSR